MVLLCSSMKPDPYFNVICHAGIEMGISSFLLVVIGDDSKAERSESAAHLERNLNTFVGQLERGNYWRRDPHSGPDDVSQLAQPELFARVVERLGWSSLRIERVGLNEDDLAVLLSDEAAKGSAFDVTACKNSAVAGAVAWLVSRGGSPVYTFELRKPQTFDAEDLLPSLKPGDYRYRNLAASPLIADATREVNTFKIQRRTFLIASILVGLLVGLLSLTFSDTVAFSILTGLASFASIMSATSLFVRSP